MKQYVTDRHLRLVGKGWEVRHQLRKLAAHGGESALLADYTKTRPPVRVKLGAAISAFAAAGAAAAAEAAASAPDASHDAGAAVVNCAPPAS